MKLIVAGEIPFIEEIGTLCLQAGHDTHIFLVEDFLGALESGYALEALTDVDVVIECHNESAATKHELLLALGNVLSPETLILSSALPVSATQAAAWVAHPSRLVGFGLLPPIPEKGLVELAPAMQTSNAALTEASLFWQGLQQEPIVVADGPGLVRARTVCCLVNEAASVLMEGVATAADIDKAMQLGTNYPHGPLAWADHIGLDAVLGVMTGLFAEWGDDRYRPSPLLRRMVLAGKLGKKTGEGFYRYEMEN
jgi:3-hydroxybutyryl-CoA dehydrogenase